ncbi:YciI family protein [Streptomyces nanhaiensis]|uniref:YciI family protein n=1 Tax=Streptomyces nanhaiensis TaxID=679319 RepID=UPI00399C9E7C
MKYLMLVCADGPVEADPEELDPRAWVEEMDRRGVRLLGERLCPPEDSTTVRVRDGGLLVTDGPFAETREQIGGFDVLECADLDEAVEVASKHPMARFGLIEVRPFWTE